MKNVRMTIVQAHHAAQRMDKITGLAIADYTESMMRRPGHLKKPQLMAAMKLAEIAGIDEESRALGNELAHWLRVLEPHSRPTEETTPAEGASSAETIDRLIRR